MMSCRKTMCIHLCLLLSRSPQPFVIQYILFQSASSSTWYNCAYDIKENLEIYFATNVSHPLTFFFIFTIMCHWLNNIWFYFEKYRIFLYISSTSVFEEVNSSIYKHRVHLCHLIYFYKAASILTTLFSLHSQIIQKPSKVTWFDLWLALGYSTFDLLYDTLYWRLTNSLWSIKKQDSKFKIQMYLFWHNHSTSIKISSRTLKYLCIKTSTYGY